MAIVKTGSAADEPGACSTSSDQPSCSRSRAKRTSSSSSSSPSPSVSASASASALSSPAVAAAAAAPSPSPSPSASSGSDSDSAGSSRMEKAMDPSPSSSSSSHLCWAADEVSEFPLELFHLPDLTKILSIEAWDSILSEEDRRNLVSFLPQMEEERTLKDTLRELLSGESFNFTSPLQDLLNLLKSGQCNPRITPYRNALLSFERREHHHNVREYHNHMINRFLEMNDLWQDYPCCSIEEKLEIWRNWKLERVKPPSAQCAEERKAGSFHQSVRVQNLLSRGARIQPSKAIDASGAFVRDRIELDSVASMATNKKKKMKKKKKKNQQQQQNSGSEGYGANAVTVVEAIEEPKAPKGVLKLLPKASTAPTTKKKKKKKKKKQMTMMMMMMNGSSSNASLTCPLSPFDADEMQMVDSSSIYRGGDRDVEDDLITSSSVMYDQPVLMISERRTDTSPVQEIVMEDVTVETRAETMVKPSIEEEGGGGEEEVEAAEEEAVKHGVLKERSMSVVERLDEILEDRVRDIMQREQTLSQGLDDENPGIGIKVEEIKTCMPDLAMESKDENGEGAYENVRVNSIADDEQTSLEGNRDEKKREDGDVVMARGLGMEEPYLAAQEMQDVLEEKFELESEGKPLKRRRKRQKPAEESHVMQPAGEASLSEITMTPSKCTKKAIVPVPPLASSFPFSVLYLLSAVRCALICHPLESLMLFNGENSYGGDYLIALEQSYAQGNEQSIVGEGVTDARGKEQDERRHGLPAVPLHEIVRRVQANPGDPRILEIQEPLEGLVRGVLKVLSSKAMQPCIKGWKPLVTYNRQVRGWSWVGPLSSTSNLDELDVTVEISHEAWSVPPKTLYKLQEGFGKWWNHEQDIMQHLGQIALLPLPVTMTLVDEKERFRELRAQKSLITINPTSEEMKAYFRKEEALRYSVPDRAFSYTCLDGRKSAVAPLRRIGGKPNSKARDHFMLKSDRPPHVTILCLVRDAASRLPGGIGTRADVCSLIRDSQYIVEEVSDVQLNQVVSGALDRLHYERDPCVRFDGDRKLWVYLHTDKDDEDFEDDATSSTKRWKRAKKDGAENPEHVDNPEFGLNQDYDYHPSKEDHDSCGLMLDFNHDLSSVYSAVVGGELLFANPSTGSLMLQHGLDAAFHGQVRDDGVLPFIELPPSIQPSCVNMQQSHPMGWEVLGNRWSQEAQYHSSDHIVQDDYNVS